MYCIWLIGLLKKPSDSGTLKFVAPICKSFCNDYLQDLANPATACAPASLVTLQWIQRGYNGSRSIAVSSDIPLFKKCRAYSEVQDSRKVRTPFSTNTLSERFEDVRWLLSSAEETVATTVKASPSGHPITMSDRSTSHKVAFTVVCTWAAIWATSILKLQLLKHTLLQNVWM